MSTIGLYISYLLPILFLTIARLRGDTIRKGPFNLGKFGLPINIFCIIYLVFIILWLPFPPYMPVTAVNMNYGGPVIGLVIIFAILDWFVWGKRRFVPPADKVGFYD